jgi:hypothetical protein
MDRLEAALIERRANDPKERAKIILLETAPHILRALFGTDDVAKILLSLHPPPTFSRPARPRARKAK